MNLHKNLIKFLIRKLIILSLVIIFFAIFFNTSFSQNTNDFKTIANGNWSNPAIWQKFIGGSWVSAGTFPDASIKIITVNFNNTVAMDIGISVDELVVNGVLTLNSGQSLNLVNGTLHDLTSNGIITGAGDINLPAGASAVFTGGTLTGPGVVNVNTGAAFYPAGSLILNRIINNSGTTTWSTGSISGSGTFNNNGIFINETAFGGSWIPAFINNGTFTKTTDNTNFFTGSFENTGTINFQSGGIIINSSGGATLDGSVNVSAGCNFQLGNGTFTTFNVNSSVSGAGTVTAFSSVVNFTNTSTYNITGVTTSLSGAMNFTPGMTLTNIGSLTPAGGTINLPSGLTVGAYNPNVRISLGGTLNCNTGKSFQIQKLFTTGTLSGTDSIFVSDSISFSSGSLLGAGPITLKAGGIAVIFNNGINLDKTFINNGTVNWIHQSISGNGSIINNSIFNMTTTANSCNPSFTNNGTFNKGSGFVSGFIGLFTNSGTGIINITNATLMLSANGGTQNIAGTVNVSSGASFQLGNTSGSTFNISGSILGAGSFYGHSANVNFLAGSSFNIAGNTGTYSGTLSFNTGMTLTSLGTINSSTGNINIQPGLSSYTIGTSITLAGGAIVNFNSGKTLNFSSITSNGTIAGSDTVFFSGTANFTGGGLTGTGPFNILAGSVINVNASGFTITKTFNNSGTFNWQQGSIFGSGVINNNNIFNISTILTPSCNPLTNNNGTINKNTSSSPFLAGGVNSTGAINITAGTFIIMPNSGTYTLGGTVNISSGAGLTIGVGNGGTATQNVSAQISGAGNVALGLPTVNFNAGCIYNITGNTTVTFGSANFSAAMTLINLGNFISTGGTTNFASGLTIGSLGSNLSIAPLGTVNFTTGKSYTWNTLDLGGNIAGTDSIFINNSLTWTNGGIASSAFILKSGAACNLNTGNGVYVSGKFINNGTFNWVANAITSAGTFLNNGTLNINTTSTPSFGPLIVNNGIINKTTANINHVAGFFTNNATININAGGISMGAGSNYGTINLSDNTTLSLNGLFTSWGTLVVVPNSFITGNSLLTYNGLSFSNNGNVSVNVQFDSITTLSGSGVFNNNATFLNGSNVTLSSNVQFKNVFINAGGSFTLNGYKAMLNGVSFANSGTFNMNNSYVEYNGVTAQGLTTGVLYKGLIINNPAGVSITSGTITVDDTLKIISGFLNVGSSALSLGSTGHLVESNGAIVKGVSGNINATRTLNNPVSINVAGLGAIITSGANLGITTITRGFSAYTINGSGSVKRYYNISPANNTGLNAALTYHYDTSELNGLNENMLSLYRSTNAGTNWSTIGGAIDTANNNVTYSGINAFSYWTAAVNPLASSINITALVDALYNTSGNTLNKKDTFTVYLRNSFDPYTILDSSKILLDTLTFSGTAYFSSTPSGIYYISIKYRNAFETWTKAGGETYTTGTSMAYNFTTAQSQSYGNSTIFKNGKYCIISGDLNQDGFVNGNDFTQFSQEFGQTGYLKADLNGDNNVNGNDFTSFSGSFGKQSNHP